MSTAVSYYLPQHEALLIDVDLAGYLIDYYVHHQANFSGADVNHDSELKEAIACFAVHLMTKPPREYHAWTVHIVSEKPYSLFVTGCTEALLESGDAQGFIVGHVLTDYVRHTDTNTLHAQYDDRKGRVFTSHIQSESPSPTSIVAQFYHQSEQNALRIKHIPASDRTVALLALPNCNLAWFNSTELETLFAAEIEKRRMRSCSYEFRCECSPEKLLPFFRVLSDEALKDLYGDDERLVISCPRCGKRFSLARSEIRPLTH